MTKNKDSGMKGLLLAGGHGTRLRPLTFTGNKHMIPIANKPMLFHGLDHLIEAGITDIAVILGPIKEGIQESLGDGSKFNVKLTYIEQPEPKGLAHAVLVAEDFLKGNPFVMYLGDNLIKQGVKPLIYTFFNEGSDCVICVSEVRNPGQYGIVEFDTEGRIKRLTEKPQYPKSNFALAGVYLFNNSIFDAVKSIQPSWRNELEITDAVQYLVQAGKKVAVQKIVGWWKDTGRPDDLLEANQLILDDLRPTCYGSVDPSAQLIGRSHIGKNTVIRQNTRIKGPVIIGDNCEIGPDVYIGPYTAVGDNVKVISGEIEGSIIMQEVIINCNKRITESIIGKRSRLESGETARPSGVRLVLGDSSFCRF